jgi:inorganic pyrophosphatase
MDEERARLTLDVAIEAVSAEGYRYEWDRSAEAIRLAGVVTAGTGWPGDLGLLTNTLGPDAQPLQVLVLGSHSTFPGCHVAAQAIGLLEVGFAGDRQGLLLAVPTTDPTQAAIAGPDDLPSTVRSALEIAAGRELPRAGAAAPPIRWGDAAEAAVTVREARRAYRLAAAQREHQVLRGPLWEVHDRTLRRDDASEAEVHTEAEYTVYALPYRFQKYARECLLPDERLLGYMLRSPVRYGGAWGLGRQRVAHEALVVITDQQVLLLADALPPDSTLVHWGYVARAAPSSECSTRPCTPRASWCGWRSLSRRRRERVASRWSSRPNRGPAHRKWPRFCGGLLPLATRADSYDGTPSSRATSPLPSRRFSTPRRLLG